MKPLKVLGILGGPRQGSCHYFLEQAVSVLEDLPFPTELESYSLRGKQMQPCIACHKCTTNGGVCILKDQFEELRQLWINADVIIYAFPVFAQGVPGQLKCFIDRLGNSFYGKYEVGSMRHMKAIVPLTVGAHLFGGQELAMNQIIQHAILLNSIPVAGDGPNSYIGAPAWTRNDLSRDALKKLAENGDEDTKISLAAAKSAVRRGVEVAAMLRSGADVLHDALVQDVRYRPYLQRIREENA